MEASSELTTVVLHVAEKPSVARALADALGGGKSVRTRSALTDVHEVNAPFKKKKNVTHRITSVLGHLLSLDFEEQFQNWDIDPRMLFHASTIKLPTRAGVASHLRKEARGCTDLVLWMDCDAEVRAQISFFRNSNCRVLSRSRYILFLITGGKHML